MASSFNRVILVGNLTRDPQLSMLPSNTAVCEFGLAMNRKWRDSRTNEMREEVCFVDIRAFGRRAETINQYMKKGQSMLVEGHLRFDQWEGKDGGKRSKLYVVVDNSQFLGGPGGGGDRGTRTTDSDEMPPVDAEMAASDAVRAPSGDDIPF